LKNERAHDVNIQCRESSGRWNVTWSSANIQQDLDESDLALMVLPGVIGALLCLFAIAIGTRCRCSRRQCDEGDDDDDEDDTQLPCGLTEGEMDDLLNRDITPEDYQLLLRLDQPLELDLALEDEDGIAPEELDAMPVSEAEFAGGECVVCISDFIAEDTVVALQCGHKFHQCCITTWLAEAQRLCPLCRASTSSDEV